MNSSTSGSSSAAAGRMLRVSGMECAARAPSSGALQTLSDTANTREQRGEQLSILAAAGAPALQEVHLHEVHRVDVRIAQADGALHGRIEIEQLTAVTYREHLRAGPLVFFTQL